VPGGKERRHRNQPRRTHAGRGWRNSQQGRHDGRALEVHIFGSSSSYVCCFLRNWVVSLSQTEDGFLCRIKCQRRNVDG
jgi:hypothetical protein